MSTNAPSQITKVEGSAHGELGTQRSQCHGPPTNPGSTPCVNERWSSDHVIDRSVLQRFWSTTTRYSAIHAAVRAPAGTHSTAPRRHVRPSADHPSPRRYASSVTTANATKGMTTDFSKNRSPPRNAHIAVTAYRRFPVRSSSTASATNQHVAVSIGREFSAADHQVKPGIASGVNSANVSGTRSTGRQPRITHSVRSSDRDANACMITRLSAGQNQFNGASLVRMPASKNAAGMTCPSWSSNRYDGENRPCVPARPTRIRSSQ